MSRKGEQVTLESDDGQRWHGTLKNNRFDLDGFEAELTEAGITWPNGGLWEKAAAAAATAVPRGGQETAGLEEKNPWEGDEEEENPWGSTQPENGGGVAPAPWGPGSDRSWEPAVICNVSGTYADDKGTRMQLVQNGTKLTASWLDGSWEEEGTVAEGNLYIFGLEGHLRGHRIFWSNDTNWERVPEHVEVPASGQQGSAWDSQDTGGPDRGEDVAAVAQHPDPQQAARRQKVFYGWQSEYLANNELPGKTEEEKADDEKTLFARTDDDKAGMDFDLYDCVKCEISGSKAQNVPELKSFEELFSEFAERLPEVLVDNIRRCGYERPTPVQKYAIPAGLMGRDLMCCAQTGSGKTAAFLIPILASMIKHGKATGSLEEPFQGPCKPDTLVMSPTRELCQQIYREALKCCHRTPHRCVRVYGAEEAKLQIPHIAKGGDLCVATPGRLWDFVASGIIDLSETQCLVLDEADRMLSMQMESSIRDVVEKYNMPPKEDRQTLMFSATFPQECQRIADDYLYDYLFIKVGVVGGAVSTITQTMLQVPSEKKFDSLIALLDDWFDKRGPSDRLLVFTNTKREAKWLDEQLYDRNMDTGALHGDLLQHERETNLDRFRKGEIEVLVATDIASRGLDICGVSHVVNYDMPWEADMYVQRIGRTGRIGHRGTAISFVDVEHDCHDMLKLLPSLMLDKDAGCNNEVPEWLQEFVDGLHEKSWAKSDPYSNDSKDAREDWNWKDN